MKVRYKKEDGSFDSQEWISDIAKLERNKENLDFTVKMIFNNQDKNPFEIIVSRKTKYNNAINKLCENVCIGSTKWLAISYSKIAKLSNDEIFIKEYLSQNAESLINELLKNGFDKFTEVIRDDLYRLELMYHLSNIQFKNGHWKTKNDQNVLVDTTNDYTSVLKETFNSLTKAI